MSEWLASKARVDGVGLLEPGGGGRERERRLEFTTRYFVRCEVPRDYRRRRNTKGCVDGGSLRGCSIQVPLVCLPVGRREAERVVIGQHMVERRRATKMKGQIGVTNTDLHALSASFSITSCGSARNHQPNRRSKNGRNHKSHSPRDMG